MLAGLVFPASGASSVTAQVWKDRVPLTPVIRNSLGAPELSRPARDISGSATDIAGHRRMEPSRTNRQTAPGSPPIVEFEGINRASGGGAVPPDVNGDVGPSHYVQSTNFSSFAVWDKQGRQLLAPTNMGSLYRAGDPCRELGRGDPVVQYDQFANRWLLTQFAFARDSNNKRVPPFYECIAITTGADPTGRYFAYTFLIDNELFPDYPHFGVWPNGYYMSVHLFDATDRFQQMGIIAFDRENMLVGGTAREIQFFTNPDYFGLLPADAQGLTPPPSNAPNYMVTFPFGGKNELDLYGFYANWVRPADSYIGGPTILPTQAFDPTICSEEGCIPQPNTSMKLDPNDNKINYPLVYRNFQDHHMLAVNNAVNVGNQVAGIRWYEIRNPGPNAKIYQQGTHAPRDGLSRWMGAMNVDGAGNFALGYSLGSASMFPSIAYAGRLADDPLGTLPIEERILLQGSGSQTGNTRWGDYVSMSIDPVDDCTFWFTNEYYSTTSDFDWRTRVFAFRLPKCDPSAPGPSPSPNPTATVTSPPTTPPPTTTPPTSPPPTATPSPSQSSTRSPTPEPSPPPDLDTTPPTLTDVDDFPDPFRPGFGRESDILWTLSEPAQVTIEIYTAQGGFLRTLASDSIDAGEWYVPWDGRSRFGGVVKAGNYAYVITATDGSGNSGDAEGTITVRRRRRR